MKTSTVLFVVFLAASYALPAQGLLNGWMNGKGRTAAAVSAFTDSYERYYVGKQQTYNPQLGTITTSGVSVYVGAGITDWLDVVVNVPFITASSNAGLWETISGVQDMQLGVKVRPLSLDVDGSRLDVMVGGVYVQPLSNYVIDAPVTIGHQAQGIDGRALVQYTTPSGLFFMGGIGYCARTTVTLDRGFDVDVPDFIDAVVRAGYGSSYWYGDVWLQNVVPQSGTNIGPGVPFPSNAQAYTVVGATLAYRVISQLSLIGGVAGTITGRNVGHSTRFNFGVAYDLPIWEGVSL